MEFIRVDSPRRLQEAAASLLPYLRQGALEQLTGEASLASIAQGTWDDLVASSFRCTTCAGRYELEVETYHGSGGTWRRRGREVQKT